VAKILIVDDSSFSRRTLRKILEVDGHIIAEAVDGLEVLSKLRELDPHVRIVVATADVQSSTRTMVANEGAKAFVSKPFAPNDVLTTVNTLLAGGGV
jgi:two-component system chemotaxis response regulator CheY